MSTFLRVWLAPLLLLILGVIGITAGAVLSGVLTLVLAAALLFALRIRSRL